MSEIEYAYYAGGKDVVLIITGIGGSTLGYKNKYDKMAKDIIKNKNCSVLIASSPQGSWQHMKENLNNIINKIIEIKQTENVDIYTFGHSAGGNILLLNAYHYPQIKKIVAVNPVMNVNLPWIIDGVKFFSGEIAIIFGEKDYSSQFKSIIPKQPNVKTITLPNIDHYFTNNLNLFISLPLKYL